MSEPSPQPTRYERENTGLEFDRAAFFSDAVYAIAMTLLVVGIGVPHVRDADLGKALGGLDSEIISFFIGFFVLAFYWLSHHALFAQLRAVNTPLLAVNLLYLAIVAFLPFPTAIVGNNGDAPLAFVLFACSLAAVSILEVGLYLCAHRYDLLRDRPTEAKHRHDIAAGLLPGVVFLLSIPLAFVDTTVAYFAWLLTFPGEQLIDRLVPETTADTDA
jgi:uncharacterized membrane protein